METRTARRSVGWAGLALTLLTGLGGEAHAVVASPHAVFERQPDGALVELRIRGDENVHWLEDAKGYTVVRDKGRFMYARRGSGGVLEASGHVVGRVDPGRVGLPQKLRPNPAPGPLRAPHSSLQGGPAALPAATGSLPNLVVLIRFADHATRPLPSQAQIDVLMNAPGGDPVLAPTGSLRDAYLEYSYGQLEVASTVLYWIDLPETEAYYAQGQSGLVPGFHEALRHALDVLEADPGFFYSDFDQDGDGQIDAITFLHSGYGAEWGGADAAGADFSDRIWSHQWSLGSWIGSEGVRVSSYHVSPALWGTAGSAIGRIGVIAHELGHFLGLPDLYDPDHSGSGIGSWGLMANSWGFDGSQLYPPHPSAWTKLELGWVTATTAETGVHSLPEAATTPSVLRIDNGFPNGEYLLVENRQPVGLDAGIPQGGLAVFHIDEFASDTDEGYPGQAGWPENGLHYRVALLQADGSYDLERGIGRGDAGDLYHAAGSADLGPETLPNTDTYQFGTVAPSGNSLTGISAAGPSMSFTLDSTAVEAAPYLVETVGVPYVWTDTSSGADTGISGDDAEAIVSIGFPFSFYGGSYDTVRVSSNGFLSFGLSATQHSNAAIPDPNLPNATVAPFWDDLDPSAGGVIRTLASGTAPLREFTIEWSDVPFYGDPATLSFQVTLYEGSGKMRFSYADVAPESAFGGAGASATVGIEDAEGSDGEQVSFLTPSLSNGSSILIGPAPACADGIDNDDDGAADYPEDPECDRLSDTNESCGLLGIEVLVVSLLAAPRRGRVAGRRSTARTARG